MAQQLIIRKQQQQQSGIAMFPLPITVVACKAVRAGRAGVPLKSNCRYKAIGTHRDENKDYYVIRYPDGDEICWKQEHFKEVH